MRATDILKAIGVALALLVINVLIAILVVLIYSILIEPGQSKEFYEEAALKISPWCSHIAGTALFLCAGYLFAKRNANRNELLFSVAFAFLYVVIDGATVGFVGVFSLGFGLSMLAKVLAALAGAYIGVRRRDAATSG